MKNIINRLCLAIVIIGISSGCGIFNSSKSETPESLNEVETGIDVSEDPLGAIFRAIELVKDAGNKDNEDTKTKESVEPISFKELMGYLPKAPSGWTAQEAQGETNSFGNYSISQVSRSYIRDTQKMEVSIFDWGLNSALYKPFLLSTEFSQESTSGYNKGIKIDDMPGREEYSYQSKKGSLNLLVDSRFLVRINGHNIKESELREWWQSIDRQSLTEIESENPS